MVADVIVQEAARRADRPHPRRSSTAWAPGRTGPAVVLHGGVARDPYFNRMLRESLAAAELGVSVRLAAADAVTGALRFARASVARPAQAEATP